MHYLLENLFGPSAPGDYIPVIWEYWRAGGWLLIPLGLVCFLIFHRYMSMRHSLKSSLATPSYFLTDLRSRLDKGRNGPALRSWLAGVPGAKARIARHLLAWIERGLPFREGYQQCRNAELMVYSHSFTILAALVVAAPLLGLLGTVLGMIGTFEAVAHRSSETSQMVAGGISQALITTQVGLVAALPGTFGIAHLSRLFKRLKSDLDGFESRLYLLLGSKGEGGASSRDRKHEVA